MRTIETNRPYRPICPPNPWYARIRERQRRRGGQYTSSRTDTLSTDLESLIDFERERAAVAGVEEVSSW